MIFLTNRKSPFFRFVASTILVAFAPILPVNPCQLVHAQSMDWLPLPGQMITTTHDFMPLTLKGLVIHPENALKFDFLMDTGNSGLKGQALSNEALKIIKYFLTALTIPENDLWVNLSPYEKNRVIQSDFSQTVMGRDLLAEDYVLKQLTASVIYPENALGEKFWRRVYQEAQTKLGTTNVPVNTFNKVWIVPSEAVVWEHEGKVLIIKNHLKVMLEEDYLSLARHSGAGLVVSQNKAHTLASQVVRQIVIPVLEKEVNEGKDFARLRQMYQAMILATWYKQALKHSILNKVYADKRKVNGIGYQSNGIEFIYRQYLKAFKKGAFNYVKEDIDPLTGDSVPRKYFSGGFSLAMTANGNSFAKAVLVVVMGLFGSLALSQRAAAQAFEVKGNAIIVAANLSISKTITHINSSSSFKVKSTRSAVNSKILKPIVRTKSTPHTVKVKNSKPSVNSKIPKPIVRTKNTSRTVKVKKQKPAVNKKIPKRTNAKPNRSLAYVAPSPASLPIAGPVPAPEIADNSLSDQNTFDLAPDVENDNLSIKSRNELRSEEGEILSLNDPENPQAKDDLVEKFKNEKDPILREQIRLVLTKLGMTEAEWFNLCRESLSSKDPDVRGAAVYYLSRRPDLLQGPGINDGLIQQLFDMVKEEKRVSLVFVKEDGRGVILARSTYLIAGELLARLNLPSERLIQGYIGVIQDLKNHNACWFVVSQLENLGFFKSSNSIPVLYKLANDHNKYIRETAIKKLAGFGITWWQDPKLLQKPEFLLGWIGAAVAGGTLVAGTFFGFLKKPGEDDHYDETGGIPVISLGPVPPTLDEVRQNLGSNDTNVRQSARTSVNQLAFEEQLTIWELALRSPFSDNYNWAVEIQWEHLKNSYGLTQVQEGINRLSLEDRLYIYKTLSFKSSSLDVRETALSHLLKTLEETLPLSGWKTTLSVLKEALDNPYADVRQWAQNGNNATMKHLGGISLNAKNLKLRIRRDSNGTPFLFVKQSWASADIFGLMPQIISIQPVNLRALFL